MDIIKDANQVSWKNLFKTITIPIGPETDCIYGKVQNRVYIVSHADGMTITTYEARGKEVDSRKYSHEFIRMFEKDGLVYIDYFSKSANQYFNCQLSSTAGITAVNQIPNPNGASAPAASTSTPTPAQPAAPAQAPVQATATPAQPVAPQAAPAAQPEAPKPEKKDYVLTEL